jgi:hypothetical protein
MNTALCIMLINVDCYAGYRAEETPRRIKFETHRVEVKTVIDRWLSPDHRYFKLLGDDGAIYIIRHDSQRWVWELVYFCAEELRSAHSHIDDAPGIRKGLP